MNPAQLKCALVFSVFAVIGFGPVSPGCLIGMFITLMRPRWFLELARDLYRNRGGKPLFSKPKAANALAVRKKCFLGLLCLFIVDIAPVQVTPTVAFFIIFLRPRWFHDLVERVYGGRAFDMEGAS
ncbi:hypothetical protein [Methylomagnum sp.]